MCVRVQCMRACPHNYTTFSFLPSFLPSPPPQECVSALRWDPTGHLLLSTGRSEVVKIWGRTGGAWTTLHSLFHTGMVNVVEWSLLAGRGPEPRLLMAA